MENSRLLILVGLTTGQYQLVVQEAALEEQVFLKCTQVQEVFQVDPDIGARATIEKGDLQCLQLVNDVTVRVSRWIHFVNLFSVLELPTQFVLGDARNAAEAARGARGRAHLLVVGLQSAKAEARNDKILTGASDHMGPVETRQTFHAQNTVKYNVFIQHR